MKILYTGPVIKTELMIVMLEKHGFTATQEFVNAADDPEDLSREAHVLVPETDYERAHRLFYEDKENEI